MKNQIVEYLDLYDCEVIDRDELAKRLVSLVEETVQEIAAESAAQMSKSLDEIDIAKSLFLAFDFAGVIGQRQTVGGDFRELAMEVADRCFVAAEVFSEIGSVVIHKE